MQGEFCGWEQIIKANQNRLGKYNDRSKYIMFQLSLFKYIKKICDSCIIVQG